MTHQAHNTQGGIKVWGDEFNAIEHRVLQDQLKTDEDKLHKMDIELAILLANRSSVIRRINRCRAVLAPYSKLPTELIAHIIKFIIPTTPPLPPSEGKDDLRLRITQVCQSWRAAAFGVSRLWDVYLQKFPKEATVNLIASWIGQCSSTQISLRGAEGLEIGNFSNKRFEIKKHILNKILIPHGHRIKDLYWFPFYRRHLNALRLDALTTLYLDYMSCYTPGERVVAPSLENVGFRNIYPPHHTRLIDDGPTLPWEQLKHLVLEGSVGIADLCDVLPQCIALRRLEIDCVFDADGVSESSLFNLPHLEELRIRFNKPATFYRFFMFSTPNLVSLTINKPPDALDSINRFTVFMRKLRWTLQHIKITRNYGFESNDTTTSIEDIMRAVPFVLRFSAKTMEIPLVTLSKIGTGQLLTNIEELHFRPCGNPWESVESLVAPTPYKVFHGSRLRDIYIYTDTPSHPLSQQIEEIRGRGINIHFTPPYP